MAEMVEKAGAVGLGVWIVAGVAVAFLVAEWMTTATGVEMGAAQLIFATATGALAGLAAGEAALRITERVLDRRQRGEWQRRGEASRFEGRHL